MFTRTRFSIPPHLQKSALLTIAVLLGAIGRAQTTYYWDPDRTGGSFGGAGTWTTNGFGLDITKYWTTNPSGGTTLSGPGQDLFQWVNNTPPDNAVFSGTVGTGNVILGTAITVGNITFGASGYTISSPSFALTLGPSSTIDTGSFSATISANLTGTATALTVTGSGQLTLSGAITGSSLTKSGSGTLILSSSGNTFTGGTTLTAGTLTVNSGASLSGNGDLVVNGGTLNLNNAAQTVKTLSGSGGTINFGSGHTLTLSQAGAMSYAGALGGSGNLQLGSSVMLTLSGGGTHTGGINVQGGSTLRLGANEGMPNSSVITLANGTFDLNGKTQSSIGTLTIGVGGGTIDFGSSSVSTIVFSASNAQTWSGTLSITNYTAGSGDSLRFGSDPSALTTGQLSAITFPGGIGAAINSSGFVTPIPEPSTYAALLGIVATGTVIYRRRKGLGAAS